MKNTRVTARRVLQGGAAFAALGALSIAGALPAAADTEVVGWAYADVAGGYGAAATYITPQGEESSDSNGGSFSIDSYFSVDASTSASVSASGSTATTTVNSARLVLTAADVEEILDEIDDEDDEEPSEEPSDEDEEPTEEPSEGDEVESETPADDEGEGDDESEAPAEDEVESEAPADPEAPVETPAEGGSEPEATESPEVTTLSEEDTELTSGGDEIVLDATISGASVTTSQSWGGEVSHSYEAGSVSYAVNELDAKFEVYSEEGVHGDDAEGYDWNDAYTSLLVDVDIPEFFTGGYVLGVTYASTGTAETGSGDNGGDNGGDTQNPPSRPTENLPKPEAKPTEALAQTGSPIAGLIAAGAAIAAGGGAAAYFARRKKNTAEAAETSEG
ncbi:MULTISPECIES: LPXTG cell wall anchor domain-containing protein [unclassified Nocardiopsis]|uniref:LPXTG cell wall anchor domain-containing protein n=1 Tax=unclassified Nocardiopsis TaxID=2649073 RepID=UPI001359C150|nr:MULTISPECIES: LPXTG cell wall anchor domain-containing protein [unclassified Nocardiopsis]